MKDWRRRGRTAVTEARLTEAVRIAAPGRRVVTVHVVVVITRDHRSPQIGGSEREIVVRATTIQPLASCATRRTLSGTMSEKDVDGASKSPTSVHVVVEILARGAVVRLCAARSTVDQFRHRISTTDPRASRLAGRFLGARPRRSPGVPADGFRFRRDVTSGPTACFRFRRDADVVVGGPDSVSDVASVLHVGRGVDHLHARAAAITAMFRAASRAQHVAAIQATLRAVLEVVLGAIFRAAVQAVFRAVLQAAVRAVLGAVRHAVIRTGSLSVLQSVLTALLAVVLGAWWRARFE